MRNVIKNLLSGLTPEEKKILEHRFGIEDETFHTLEETGKMLGVTRERIRQIEAKALEKLRKQYDIELEKVSFLWSFNPYRCLCGKYKRKRYLGVFCDKCGVECQDAKKIIKATQEIGLKDQRSGGEVGTN